MNILLTLLLAVNLLILSLLCWGFRSCRRLLQQGRAFITPESEGKPSPLANITQVTADMVGRAISASLKATFMGKASVISKNEAKVDNDIVMDSIGLANPLISTLLGNFPSLKKTLTRNPALLDIALQKLTQGRAALTQGESHSGSDGHQVKFNL